MKKRLGVVMYQTSRSKGQELVAQRMVHYLGKLGHDAFLITSVFHDGKEIVDESIMGPKGYIQSEETELGIPVIRVASLVSRWPPRRIVFKDFIHTLERIVNEFGLNVLITHSTLWNGPEEVAKFVQWRRNIKALGGYQDPLVFCHMSHFQEPSPRRYSVVERSFRLAWTSFSLRQILRVANLTLVVSPFEEKSKIKMGARRESCLLFPGGVDDETFLKYASVDLGDFKQKLRAAPNGKIVSYLGSIEPRKNPAAVLRVAEKLSDRTDIHFAVAGRGDSEFADEFRKRAEALPNVTYLGEINDKEKLQLIRSSYLNILLSRIEALGLAQLEFMYNGIPVITSAVGGQSWIVRDGQEGIHVKGPRDIDGAIKAIVELVEEPSKWEKLSASAKERARSFALSILTADLDDAITRQLEKESGLSLLSPEVRSTLVEPELVVKAWSHGSMKVVATNRKLYIQQGRFSRRTMEVPLASIRSVEHVRQYRWRTLAVGSLITAMWFVENFLFPIFSRPAIASVVEMIRAYVPTAEWFLSQTLPRILVLPALIAVLLFASAARTGYALHGVALRPVYLPQSFGETIKFVREALNRTLSGQGTGTPPNQGPSSRATP